MSYADYLRQTVTIQPVVESTTAVDDQGNPVKSDGATITTVGLLEPLSEQEQLVQAETYRVTHRLFLPAGTAINGPDLVQVNGTTFEVLEVLPFINPRTNEDHHIECRLVEVIG